MIAQCHMTAHTYEDDNRSYSLDLHVHVHGPLGPRSTAALGVLPRLLRRGLLGDHGASLSGGGTCSTQCSMKICGGCIRKGIYVL